MNPTLSHHWRFVEDGWIHYRRIAASGPNRGVLLALHGSPQSGQAMLAFAQQCAAIGFVVIAPDSPGNGMSDPLAETADIHAYAARMLAFVRAIGVTRAGVYGFHTGAAIAAALAAQAPDLISGLLLDGLPIWTPQERAALLANYLAPFTPHWDGSHLAWLWARVEEQAIFFPWNAYQAEARLANYAVSEPKHLDANALDMLKAGDSYRAPYAAAFRFEAAPILTRMTQPCLLTASPRDPLFAHLQRAAFTQTSHYDAIDATGDDRASALARCFETLGSGGDPAPAPATSGTDASGETRGYLKCAGGEIGFRGRADAGTIVLHDAGESAALIHAEGAISVDLPGHGEAGWTWAQAPTRARDFAEAMAPVLAQWPGATVSGNGLGARIAGEISGKPIPAHASPPPPDLEARWDGTHLLSAWRYLRRTAIFTHWDRPDSAHYRSLLGALDAAHLNARLIALLLSRRAHASAWAALTSPA
jgi:pimeloyl-ACP methyl ester carboxylesterase